jgi:hypothetical protein
MPSVKGNAVLNVTRYVEVTYGPGELSRLIGGLLEPDRAILRGLILPGGWYPIGLWNRLLDHFVEVLGRGDPQSFRPVAEFIAENDMTMIFKVLLKIASPAMIVERSPSLWERYFDVGAAVPIREEPDRYVVVINAPREPDQGPGVVTCAAGVPAWLMRAVSLAGAKWSYAHERACRFRGARACEIEVGWR